MTPSDPLAPLIATAVHGLLGTLLPLIIFVTALLAGLKPLLKGAAGEKGVARRLRRLGFPCLHDIVTPATDGMLTQVDHLVLTARGPLAIETKNYAGSIYGRREDREWTQALGKTKSRFQNPLRQNFKHIAALRHRLGTEVLGLVVFVGTAKFPKGVPEGVVTLPDLARHMEALGRPSPGQSETQEWQEAHRIADLGRGLKKAHRAGLTAKYGRDPRARACIALACIAVVIFVVAHA